MGEIVNLRRARKRLEREKDVAQAETNRAAFGRSKAEKARDIMISEQLKRALDGALREDDKSEKNG
ncbi:DUF4169 family protein [Brytella acorum]|uniref:DUF4169 family protein n=1 Tax=Brytella acorum TaxID=2959299 RepID=A0AA35UYC6_9PROT|nr:DUF4169 family protein [Brytella acorum]MDF3624320.1 DUF4169 family protein [Brytella acorum]CAI9121717.1 DUF4169 family protein [Brytella acorum]